MPDKPDSILPPIFQHRLPCDGEQAFRDWLAALSGLHTGKVVAQAAGISPSRLSGLIHGRACLGPDLLARFGYRREVRTIYVSVEEVQPTANIHQPSANPPEELEP